MNHRASKTSVTIFTEGSTKSNGVNKPPTVPKPNVQPAGQNPSPQNGSQAKEAETKK